ncbi:hypothetical protein KUTeg_003601 [Tegillarca granosa]|uniref:DUF4371 domain-containing protein n=1 Tax=Tegillarca granosa TaxID=220873 RepID=A0ABQ9FS15_TEGGR|nr:hypothetical protein KUTeg_003601 [Tegillarca granosa]
MADHADQKLKQTSLLSFLTNSLVHNHSPHQSKWQQDFDGLIDTKNGMVCTIFQDLKNISDASSSFLTGNKTYRIESIRSHFMSPKHLCCVQAKLVQEHAQVGQLQGPMDVVIQKIGDKNKIILSHMFNTAYFVLKEELPFTKFPSLVRLQVKNGSDLGRIQSYVNDKACARFAPHISAYVREKITDEVQNSDVLSVIFDGATDCAISEVEIVYCRICVEGVDLEHAHSQGTFDAIDRAMTKFGCNDWKEKLVAIGCDGAKVNIGVNDSVATRMKADG